MSYPVHRPQRLRRNARLRAWVAESRLDAGRLVQPLFVCPGRDVSRPIASLPGQAQLSADRAAREAAALFESGLRSVILFGIPARKDALGSESVDPKGVVPVAVRAIKESAPEMIVIGDVCLCEFTDHGHCGVLRDAPGSGGDEVDLDNEATIEILGRQAVVLAEAGCDVVAPSAMADGQVAAIREALDAEGHEMTPILSYAAKYASHFYGPFRQAAENAPAFGDRRGYQMDPANAREAMREVALDVEEGADMVMVKPALPCLDIIARVREAFEVPVAAYQVSGEYAMLEAAGKQGWLDAEGALLESLGAIRRAGADVIVSYAAGRVARMLSSGR